VVRMEALIDLKNADPGFRLELAEQPEGKGFMACLTCRTCVCGCPVARVNPGLNPARIIRMVNLGLKDEVLSSDFIWLCTGCYTCQEACPMRIRITDLITLLKNMAVKQGHIPQGVQAQMDIIGEHSRIYPIDDFDNKKRNKLDLPSLPTHSDTARVLWNHP